MVKAAFILALSTLLLSSSFVDAGYCCTDCGGRNNFGSPATSTTCMTDWQKGNDYSYPDDFQNILNEVDIYTCPTSNARIIISNGIPDHDITLGNNNEACVINWAVSMPLNPTVIDPIEIPSKGIIAIALNGVPAFGAQEVDDANAVEPDGQIKDAQFWYGHGTKFNIWHFHNPYMGQEEVNVDSTTLLGYALDGFPIYGPYSGTLDACNGRVVNNKYQYHVKTKAEVDENLDYCKADDNPETNWNYILGCYRGTTDDTYVEDNSTFNIPTDCVKSDDSPTSAPTSAPTNAPIDAGTDSPTVSPPPTDSGSQPNIIVMQPDDMVFFDNWSPPPNNPGSNKNFPFPSTNGMPHMETLRLNGLQMMEAYTASPACGTSRYSTITGKYPSRAASLREKSTSDIGQVTIPATKLMDVGDEKDCSEDNIAMALKNAGYRTGMVGKWHLSRIDGDTYEYFAAIDIVKGCGFDFVDALYIENMEADPADFDNYSDGTFSHNMEFITYEAVNFINQDDGTQPFFLYVNPTVPHSSQSVTTALNDFTCQDTPRKDVTSDLMIKGMTEEFGSCDAYRANVAERADTEDDLGSIWLDDSVGAILQALADKGILDNTLFLFQHDHGVETKKALYENGNRIAQFIHYPDVYSPGSTYDIPVSTVDIAATLLDFAGVEDLPYGMDGQSWRNDAGSRKSRNLNDYSRCLFFEMEFDRAIRCGCDKFLAIKDLNQAISTTYKVGVSKSYSIDNVNLFDLCGGTDSYITDKDDTQEDLSSNLADGNSGMTAKMQEVMDCHLLRTKYDTPAGDYTSCEISPQTNPPTPTKVTDPPTVAPTKVPTAAPTNSPTVAQTNSPTVAPTKVPTVAPTNSPTVSPTKSPTVAPTNLPTATPPPTVAPTNAPTIAPTNAPTVTPDDCVDGSEKFFYKLNKKKKPVTKPCTWLAKHKKKAKFCSQLVDYYGNFGPPQDVCQKTCASCGACFENPNSNWVFSVKKKTGKVVLKTCSWLAEHKKKKNYCKKKKLVSGGYNKPKIACPVTCLVGDCA